MLEIHEIRKRAEADQECFFNWETGYVNVLRLLDLAIKATLAKRKLCLQRLREHCSKGGTYLITCRESSLLQVRDWEQDAESARKTYTLLFWGIKAFILFDYSFFFFFACSTLFLFLFCSSTLIFPILFWWLPSIYFFLMSSFYIFTPTYIFSGFFLPCIFIFSITAYIPQQNLSSNIRMTMWLHSIFMWMITVNTSKIAYFLYILNV